MKNAKKYGRYVVSVLLIVCMLAGIGLTHISGYAEEAEQEAPAAPAADTAATTVAPAVEAASVKVEKTTAPVEKASSSAPAESAPKAATGSSETAAPVDNSSSSAPAESVPKATTGSSETAAPADNSNSAPAESAPKAVPGSSETAAPADNTGSASDDSVIESVPSGSETAPKAENNSVVEVSGSGEAAADPACVADEDAAASNDDVIISETGSAIGNSISAENSGNSNNSGSSVNAGSVETDVTETEKSEEPALCYEVDFSYDGNKVVLQGGDSSELDAVLDQLGLSGEISSVVSSNPELFSCEQVDGVWMLSANSAFTSDEKLTVTLEDGSVLEIGANDDFAGNSSGKIMCVYDNETKTLTIKLADNEEVPVLENLEGETDEERSERLSAYAVQDIGGEKGLLKSLSSIVEKIVLMEGVTGIGWDENRPNSKGVFQAFTALTEVEASSTLVNIGWSAFRKCTNLKVFDFASCTNLETIRQQAFSTTALEEADMSGCENLETIGRGAFEYDSSLKSVTIPTAVKAIDDTAFNSCTGIEKVVYNAADYEYCLTNNSKDKREWFSSKTFKATDSLTLEIGTDVEILPRGFFKAFVNAGEQVSFAGIDDGDPDTVSGRVVRVHEMAGENGNEPFRSFPSEVIVDESGVLYKNNGNGVEMLYVSSGIAQYTLPDEIIVNGEAFAEDTVDYSSFGRVIRYSVAVDSIEDVTFEGSMPGFRASGRVLAVADTVNTLSSDDLTGLTCTAVAEDGTIYSYELIGWLCGEEEIDLGAEITLNGDDDVLLTARWNVTVIPAEDEAPETPEDAPAEESKDVADVPVNAPAAAQTARTADKVAAVKTADNEVLQTVSEEIAVPASSEIVEELSARVDTEEEDLTIEEIFDEETPLAAQAESESTDILEVSLAMIMIIIAMFIYMMITKKQEENT